MMLTMSAGSSDSVPEDLQVLRADLKERALELWLSLRHKRVKLHLHGGVVVVGTFEAVDAKEENIVVANLESGIGVVPMALIRWSDILSMTSLV